MIMLYMYKYALSIYIELLYCGNYRPELDACTRLCSDGDWRKYPGRHCCYHLLSAQTI